MRVASSMAVNWKRRTVVLVGAPGRSILLAWRRAGSRAGSYWQSLSVSRHVGPRRRASDTGPFHFWHGDVAEDLAKGLLGLQWPGGAFLSNRGQLDGTGQMLWVLEQTASRHEVENVRLWAAASWKAFIWRGRARRANGGSTEA